ncbi:DUF58 domain-containing protein [Bacillus luteolus]|uniref:DUF58 domain-containing protein n=1 Tax=Litchfieldia luteola TaxID=682179 RepID=A0ABR9QPH2_9BACI|nr:DUF58 domain-containing protein [Cytobacillus luteolus]MBE4910406.1 DUF58 domain-containing protein [Cytobacillus luteolus]MBP1942018.1 uncharacterized protein (DUF58 family) [Cytobacillus luteolus]
MWHKQVVENKLLNFLSFFAWIILGASLYTESILLFVFACFFIVFDFASKLYMKYVANELVMDLEKQRLKLFAGEDGYLKLRFIHYGHLPIINAQMRITIDNIVSTENYQTSVIKNQLEINIPISVSGREELELHIPLIAQMRGVARIRKLNLMIHHPFGFGFALLENKVGINHEIIIYPNLLPVVGFNQMVPKESGTHFNRSSLFVNHSSTIGTRDYLQTDPFNRLHWKASARTSKLQTKILEPTSQNALTLIINLKEDNGVIGNLEEVLSHVAYIAHVVTKQNREFQVYINTRPSSKTPIYHLPLGSGKEQLAKALEMLARVNKLSVLIPFDRTLRYIEKHYKLTPFTITCGPITESIDIIYNRFSRKGIENYTLSIQDEKGYIVKMLPSHTKEKEGEVVK